MRAAVFCFCFVLVCVTAPNLGDDATDRKSTAMSPRRPVSMRHGSLDRGDAPRRVGSQRQSRIESSRRRKLRKRPTNRLRVVEYAHAEERQKLSNGRKTVPDPVPENGYFVRVQGNHRHQQLASEKQKTNHRDGRPEPGSRGGIHPIHGFYVRGLTEGG